MTTFLDLDYLSKYYGKYCNQTTNYRVTSKNKYSPNGLASMRATCKYNHKYRFCECMDRI